MFSMRSGLFVMPLVFVLGFAISCKTSSRKAAPVASTPPPVVAPVENCASLYAVGSGTVDPRRLVTKKAKAEVLKLGADKSFSSVKITSVLADSATLGYYKICSQTGDCDRGFLAYYSSDPQAAKTRIAYDMMEKRHDDTPQAYTVSVASCVWRDDVLDELVKQGLKSTTTIPLLDEKNKHIGSKELYCGGFVKAGEIAFSNNDQSSFQYIAQLYAHFRFRMFIRSQSLSTQAQAYIDQITDPKLKQAAEAFSAKPDLIPVVAAQTDLNKLAELAKGMKSENTGLALSDGQASGCIQNTSTSTATTPTSITTSSTVTTTQTSGGIGGTVSTTTTTSSTVTTTQTTSVTTTDSAQLEADLNAASCEPGSTYNPSTQSCELLDSSNGAISSPAGYGKTNQVLPPVRPREQLKQIGAGVGMAVGAAAILGGAAWGHYYSKLSAPESQKWTKYGTGAMIAGFLSLGVSAYAYGAGPNSVLYLGEDNSPEARFSSSVNQLFKEGQDAYAQMETLAAPQYLALPK